jgi:hypothetical protein
MKTTIVWKGTRQESLELIAILRQACSCPKPGAAAADCASHRMLFDQRVVDGLLFARRIAERLILEEFGLPVAG